MEASQIKNINDLGPDFTGGDMLPEVYSKVNIFEVIQELISVEVIKDLMLNNSQKDACSYFAKKIKYVTSYRKWVLYPLQIDDTELLRKRLNDEDKACELIALRVYRAIDRAG